MENRYSLDSFFQYIKFITDRNLVTPSTCENWRMAGLKFKELIVQEGKEKNLPEINLDELIIRFNHRYSKELTASSLNVYASRIRSAFNNFFEYTKNPATYKPSPMTREKNKVKNSEKKKNELNSKPESKSFIDNEPAITQSQKTILNSIPIPLRKDLVIQIYGLPFDLSKKEAEKIAAIVRMYSTEEELFEQSV